MKLFDVNWLSVLLDLPRWWALPLGARRVLLNELKPSGYVQAHHFAPHLDAIVSSGIANYDHERDRLWLGDARRGLVKVLRAMSRHPLFDHSTQHTLMAYMGDHFTSEDFLQLGSDGSMGRFPRPDKHSLGKRVAFAGWTGDLLEAQGDNALLKWATARGLRTDPSRVDVSVVILRELQVLARQLLAYPRGATLREIVTDPLNKNIAALADAIYAGLGTMVLFAAMRSDDLEPMIGLWPTVVRDLTTPSAARPVVAHVVEQFTLAVDVEDMTTVLSAVAASPVRVRANDFAVFARTRAEIETRLVALPPWSADIYPGERVDTAAGHLRVRGFVRLRDLDGNPHLFPTPAGTEWLALSPHDRLAAILEPLRQSKEVNPRNAYDASDTIGFFPYTLPYFEAPKSLRLRDNLTHLLLDVTQEFIPITEFMEYAARSENPFLALPPNEIVRYSGGYYGMDGDPREFYRETWRSMLFQFLQVRLAGLGGASIGLSDKGDVCFALTDIGRYLLGTASSFEYGSNDAADIVVQPNFDVVFMGAAPSIEAEIARFAERVGRAPGHAFRLTRASVLQAAEAGVAVADVIGALTRASSKPIPKNVQREIAGWMSAVRRATMRKTELLEVADEESAARIVALLGDKVRQITPTVFELPPMKTSARNAMVKKLRAGGVFLADVTARREPKPAAGFDENEWDE